VNGEKAVEQGTCDMNVLHSTAESKQSTSSQSFSYANVVISDLVTNKKWSPNVILTKEDLPKMPVWVKLHNVPMLALSSDILSRGSFTRALIELDATFWLKDRLVVVVPKLEGLGYIMETIRVEYEWKPPRCDDCEGSSRKTGIWSAKKADSNIAFSPETKLHYFDRDVLKFANMDHAVEEAEHENVPSEHVMVRNNSVLTATKLFEFVILEKLALSGSSKPYLMRGSSATLPPSNSGARVGNCSRHSECCVKE
nr:hypothetical protein [Tanacetum cinerariifolium]